MEPFNEVVAALVDERQCSMHVRKAGVFRFPNSYRFQSHSHIEYEINYVSAGSCMMTFGEEYVPLRQGACIIIPPHYQHGFIVDLKGGCKITQVEMSLEIPTQFKDSFPFCSGERAYYVMQNCEDMVQLMEQVARVHRGEWQNGYTKLQLRLAILQLITGLTYHTNKATHNVDAIKNKKVRWVLSHIHAHYNEAINIEEIASSAGISSRYLRRYFAEGIGMSCMEYVTVLRMNRAKELFWETNKSVTEVAMETGYSSSQYFCRVFKEYVGVSPKQYKDTWKEEKQYL